MVQEALTIICTHTLDRARAFRIFNRKQRIAIS